MSRRKEGHEDGRGPAPDNHQGMEPVAPEARAKVSLAASPASPSRPTLEDCLRSISEQRAALDWLQDLLIESAREPVPPQEAPLLDAEKAGRFLGIPTSRVYELARQGKIPTVRIGPKCVRFRPAALHDWIVGL